MNKFFTLSLDLFCIRGNDGRFEQLNPAWEKVLGWTVSELLNIPWIELVHADDVEGTVNTERQCIQQEIIEYENRYRHKDGSYRWLSWRISQAEDGFFYGVAKDVTTVKQDEERQRQHRNAEDTGQKAEGMDANAEETNLLVTEGSKEDNPQNFCVAPVQEEPQSPCEQNLLPSASCSVPSQLERLITRLAAKLINLAVEEIDSEISLALQAIAKSAGFDRSFVMLFSDDGTEAELAYEWHTEAAEPLPDQLARSSIESLPGWIEKIRPIESIQVYRRTELPAVAANMRQFMELAGMRSLIVVPMVRDRSLVGNLGFATVTDDKTGSDDAVELLTVVGEIFANALNRKQTELKLRDSERRFHAVFNQTFQFSSLLKLDGTMLEDNQTALDFCQLERKDIIGRPFWDLRCWTISSETQDRLKQAIAQAAAGNVVRYEENILAPDDSVITIDFSLKPLLDESGRVELLIAEGRDLTQRKQAEQQLQQTLVELTEWKNRAEAASEINNLLVYEWNSETEEVIWGSNVEQVFGYTREELTGSIEDWMKLIHPNDVENVIRKLEGAIATKEPVHIEYRMLQKDGTYITIEDKGRFYPDSAGHFNRMIGFLANITERKQAEAEQQKVYQQLTLLIDNSPLAILEWDNKFCLQRWSKQAEQIFGWKASEVLNKHPRDWQFVYDEDAQTVDGIMRQLLDGTHKRTVDENRNYTKNGAVVHCEWYNSALFDESGNLVSILSLVLDVTERKRAETALQEVMAELETRVEERTAELQQANEQLNAEIAERQKTEAALRQSEEQFRRVFDEAPIGMALTGKDKRFLRVNQTLLEMLGYSESEFKNLTCKDITHPEDWQKILPFLDRIYKGEIDGLQVEERFLKKNQDILWGNLTSMVMYDDESGEILYGLGMVEDITERKQAEDALRHSEEQFRRVFDEAPIGMSLASLDDKYIRVNRAFFEMLGYTESELMALSFLDITCPDDLEQEVPYMEQLVRGEIDSFTLEKRYFKKNQEIVWVKLTLIALRDRTGEILYTLAMIEDITERKQAEEALHQSEARYRAIIEDQTELICRFRRDGTFTFANNAFCRYFNKQRSELIGDKFRPVIPEEDLKLVAQSFNSLSLEQPIITYENRVILSSGETHWQQWTNRALFDESGNLQEIQAVGRDITKLKQAEAEILKALEKERELSELRSGFVSLVSHEFRTPLTTIQSSIELLERYNNKLSDEKKHNHFRRIQAAVKRMTQLLEDILTIGKAEAGKLKFEPSPMNLVAFCQELVESLQMSAQSRHKLNFVVRGDRADVQMDERLLGHILTNLLSNAMKYSPDGGTVQFELVCDRTCAVFRVQDSGIGIPPEDIERLFESFGRAGNVGTIPGTGLGLAIVKRCVDLHRGTITVESEVGVGTTFTVTLPLKFEPSAIASREEQEKRSPN